MHLILTKKTWKNCHLTSYYTATGVWRGECRHLAGNKRRGWTVHFKPWLHTVWFIKLETEFSPNSIIVLSFCQRYTRRPTSQWCSTWYLYLYSSCTRVQFWSICTRTCTWTCRYLPCTCSCTCRHVGHFCNFVKAKTEQVHLFLWMICVSSTAIFRCALWLIECPGMLATCMLSIKQTFSDWIDRWQPDRKSHLYQFLFSVCHLELASKSWWWYIFSDCYVWSGIFCDFGVCCTVAKQLKWWSDFWYGLLFVSEYSDRAIRWLFSSSVSSNPKVKLPWIEQVSGGSVFCHHQSSIIIIIV